MTPKTKPPRWFQLRKNASRFLVWLARKINPDCPYNYSYFLEQMTKAHIDSMTYGTGVMEIGGDPVTFQHKLFKEMWDENPEWAKELKDIDKRKENWLGGTLPKPVKGTDG